MTTTGTPGSDAAVVAASLVDAACFDAVFDRHHDAVFRYVASRLGPETAEDVVADVFAIAFTARAKFNPKLGASARPWLLGIATKRIARQRDAQRRWLQNAYSASVETHPGADDGAAGRADAARFAPALVRGLADLSHRQREPFLLHVLGELSYEEVATALDVPVGTVRSRINRARARLAGSLDGAAR